MPTQDLAAFAVALETRLLQKIVWTSGAFFFGGIMEKWQFSIEDIEKGSIAFAWENYAKAMSKRRPDTAVLPYERFENYVLMAETFVASNGNNAIIGQMNNGVFCPSHFAPYGLKGGIDLIKELRKDNVIFAVTEDLGDMLKKLGYKFLFKAKACFRDEEVEKVVYTSSYKAVAVYFSNKLLSALKEKARKVFLKIRKSFVEKAISLRVLLEKESKEELIDDYSDYQSMYR